MSDIILLRSGDIELPPPTALTVDNEIIWTADTGRTLSALMVGEAIAEKMSIGVKWEWLQDSEVFLIKKTLVLGFFPLTVYDMGEYHKIQSYRGTLSKQAYGQTGDGIYWYETVNVDIIQR